MTDLDDAYANMVHIPGGESYAGRWEAASAAFCAAHPPDSSDSGLFWRGAGKGLVVFVHGGYWLWFTPESFAHLAQGALAAGWSVFLPRYTLAPAARIAEITTQVAARIADVAGQVAGPIRLTGHSAGGHLAARMVCPGVLPPEVVARIERVLPISPLSDLAPLMELSMNADLKIDPEEAWSESPVCYPPPACSAHVWVGAVERPVFLDHARWLAEAWSCPLTAEPARHHYDVIEGLERPSPLLSVLLG